MNIDDDHPLAAGIKELQALKRLYALLDLAPEETMHPDLGLVDVPNISDAMSEVSDGIEEREDALHTNHDAEPGLHDRRARRRPMRLPTLT